MVQKRMRPLAECGHLLLSIKNGLVGLKIHVQKKCWCKHALQSQWGESLSFIPLSLLRLDMQAPGWLCYWRGLASGAALRPAETTDLWGLDRPSLPACLPWDNHSHCGDRRCSMTLTSFVFPSYGEKSGLQLFKEVGGGSILSWSVKEATERWQSVMHISTQCEGSASCHYSDSKPRTSTHSSCSRSLKAYLPNTFLAQLCLKLVVFDVKGSLIFFLIFARVGQLGKLPFCLSCASKPPKPVQCSEVGGMMLEWGGQAAHACPSLVLATSS